MDDLHVNADLENEQDFDEGTEEPQQVVSKKLVSIEKKDKDKEKDKGTKKRKRRKDVVTFCAIDCKYEVIFDAVREMGWKIVGKNADNDGGKAVGNGELPMCHIHWVDVANIHERMRIMQPWQRINHFPGMPNIARKARLAQNLEKMRKNFPKEYAFYPRTWVLPADFQDFRTQFDSNGKSYKNNIFIVKPDAGCQGRGIYLTQDLEKISSMDSLVAQQYIRKPLLIDDFKFDLRLYVLVTSVKPLRIYMFNDGLVRLCTEEYVRPTSENLGDRCMHLTNYAINKNNENFQANEDADDAGVGSKRSLRWFMEWLAEEQGEEKAEKLWRRMGSLSTKVIISILPQLSRELEPQPQTQPQPQP
mmetsp:Transcript_18139/g.47860  ORF Transcript_18139/g.47860 Transcript_18139/m.47860 type:complete len:361 (-) Transcript_18139:51-1133(-)